jgi:hypothetical protein
MRYMLKCDDAEYEVSKTAVPKVDERGVQKVDPVTHLPVWSVQVTAWNDEDTGADVMVVSVPAEVRPELRWREPVTVTDLEIIPWTQKRRDGEVRSGVAFKASAITSVGAARLAGASA